MDQCCRVVLLSIGNTIIRLICASIHIGIIVPLGILINLPPLLYWVVRAIFQPKEYDVDLVAPFLSPKTPPANAVHGEILLDIQRRPRIFFDGCAWCIGFEMGVCQHILQVQK